MYGVSESDSRTTPPSPGSTGDGQRQLHHSSTPQRRLFTCNAQQNNDCQIGMRVRNHTENRFVSHHLGNSVDGHCSRTPNNLEDIHYNSGTDFIGVSHDFEGTHQDSETIRIPGIEPPRVAFGNFSLSGVSNNLEDALCNTEGRGCTGLEHSGVINDTQGPQNEFRHFDEFELAEVPYKERPPHFEDSFDGNFDTSTLKPNEISDQQWKVLEAISQGKSVFVTGSAGTGKSYLLKYAIKVLSELHGRCFVFVTASTGIAACQLKGRTLHSFAGVKLGEQSAWALAAIVEKSREASERWMYAKALVIDEISMIDGEFFDKLEYIARKLRKNNEVFGGLQLVVTGDFFQLPPVKPTNYRKEFAFEADCWSMCFDTQIELKEVFRQVDGEFVCMLEEIRKASCSPRTILRLNSCMGESNGTDEYGIIPTRLFPTKVDVRKYNDRELMALNKDVIPFTARDTGSEKSLLDCGVAPKELYLCEGAQVMLIWNLDVQIGLANGSRGMVVGFTCCEMRESRDITPTGLWPVVQFGEHKVVVRPVSWDVHEKDNVIVSRTQVPLILAWALSVHKCQGLTLDRVEADLSKAFEFGMVYVALSRVKHFKGFDSLASIHTKSEHTQRGSVFSTSTHVCEILFAG